MAVVPHASQNVQHAPRAPTAQPVPSHLAAPLCSVFFPAGAGVHTDNPTQLFQILSPSFNAAPDLRAQLASPRNNIVEHNTAGSSAGARQLHALEM